MNRKLTALFVICAMIITGTACKRTNNLNNEKNMENLNLTAEWDGFGGMSSVGRTGGRVGGTGRGGASLAGRVR